MYFSCMARQADLYKGHCNNRRMVLHSTFLNRRARRYYWGRRDGRSDRRSTGRARLSRDGVGESHARQRIFQPFGGGYPGAVQHRGDGSGNAVQRVVV